MAYPDNNPKTAIGVTKAPLHLVPPIAEFFLSQAFADGGKKYGPFNWRQEAISASVYYAAALRHMKAWYDGEDVAPDSGVHHLAHAMACFAMLLDAASLGKLNDDRPPRGMAPELLAEYAARHKQPPPPDTFEEELAAKIRASRAAETALVGYPYGARSVEEVERWNEESGL